MNGTLDAGHPNLLKGAETGAPLESQGEQLADSRSVPLLVEAANLVILCEAGRTEDARDRFVATCDEPAHLGHDWTALTAPALASVACAHLGDAQRAKRLYAMLEPYAGQFVDAGPAWFGSPHHHLGLLASTLGRVDEADSRLAATVDAYEALGAEAWLARARLDWARALLSRRSGRDTEDAEGLLRRALAAAETLDLRKVGRHAASLLSELAA